MRQRQCIVVGVLVFFSFCLYSILRLPADGTSRLNRPGSPPSAPPSSNPHGESHAPWPDQWDSPFPRPKEGPKPKPAPDTSTHPISYLLQEAQRTHGDMMARQSKTLAEAVGEYRRRYGMAPPPHFDRWFEFASRNGVQLVDEFDTIHELMTPFWGLKPATVRARAREALGGDNFLLGIAIRGHNVTLSRGGPDWQRSATEGMMAKFLPYLPDMDLAFNVHDEPRVMVPYDDLTRLVRKARDGSMAAAAANSPPPKPLVNDFSPAPADLGDGQSFSETKLTRFNVFAHQPTWTHSRMSCPPDSPARVLEEDERADDVSRYGLSELGFVYNATAMSDICLTPSLGSTFGFFDRPNAYNVVHDLFPVFSQSKISSYSDIIYPSPWYWHNKVAYDDGQDRPWARKQDRLYWRGSTTGGFSRGGGWRRQHRQHMVRRLNARDQALVMEQQQQPSGDHAQSVGGTWEARRIPRRDLSHLIDVHFSHIGQCDPGDCAAQTAFFDVKDRAKQHDAWSYKYFLDIDGNAFSGRFYAFLKSRSLTFKLALFREWHAEWLRPWVHYVPLSPQGDDWLEAVRFFANASLSGGQAEAMAGGSREWAGRVVRKEDMEVWFFRLLLEYGRVIDDNRETIGYNPSSAKTATNPG